VAQRFGHSRTLGDRVFRWLLAYYRRIGSDLFRTDAFNHRNEGIENHHDVAGAGNNSRDGCQRTGKDSIDLAPIPIPSLLKRETLTLSEKVE
jgi:hypothetical protein